MKLQKKMWALGLVAALVAALIGFLMPSANATSNPPWEPDPQSLGTITFYDSSGNVVTGGNDLTNLFTYAAASTATPASRAGTTKAFISYAFPDHTKITAQYGVTPASFASAFPVTSPSAPANIKALTFPVVNATGTTTANLTGVLGQGTFDPTAGYDHVLQLRLGDSGPGISQDPTQYWDADIQINTTAGTWTQIYPTPVSGPTTTTTAVTASVASPQPHGTSIKFTATVTPTAAGSVQFSDNGSTIGAPVTVAAGKADFTTSTLGVGSHSITAAFTPTDTTAFTGSTSPAFPYSITSSAVSTTTTLGVTPTSPITAGTSSTLTANVLPSTAVGSVQFFDGSTAIGSPVTVSAGTATLAHSFAAGNYSLKATFTPTDSTAFTGSSSSSQAYVVNPPATHTTTALAITPAGPQVFGTSLTFTATVTPSSAVGSVKFFDGGSTLIGTASVTSGVATITSSALAAGDHSIQAQFVPTDATVFETSLSSTQSYTITKANTSVSVAASPATTQQFGSNVTLTATVGPSGAGGTVQFAYVVGGTPTNIGPAEPVSGTTATLMTVSLPLTTEGIRAVYTPDANHNPSTSSDLTYAITPIPPGDTSTGLTVTPAGPVAPGTVETLHATVSPSTAAGTIQFMDGASMVGSPVTVSAGVAQTTTTLATGDHSLGAMFLAADSTKFNDSAAMPVSYTVLPPAAATTTTLAIGPASSEPYGTAVSFTATVSPNTAAGSVTFKDGSTVLGTVAVSSGTATYNTSALHGGSHNITAVFGPSAPLLFAPSTSATSALTITAVSTTTSIAINPLGPVSQGASVTLTAVLTPSVAVGSVAFRNGSTLLGTATLVGGTATLTTKALPIGADSITGTFTATRSGDFSSSTSAPATISVLLAPSIASVFANGKLLQPGGSTVAGASLQIHAEGFQPNETITVNVHSTTIKVGSVKASATGFATVTVVLPANLALGTHTLSMVGSIGTANFTFVVAKPSSTSGGGTDGGGGLAHTGVDAQVGILLGLLLLTSGLMLIGVARRRGVRG